MDTPEIHTPCYYLCGRVLTDEQCDWVRHVLSFTPVLCAIYWDPYDAELARKLCDETIVVADEPAAHKLAIELARQTGFPSLLVGSVPLLEAVYGEGRQEQIY